MFQAPTTNNVFKLQQNIYVCLFLDFLVTAWTTYDKPYMTIKIISIPTWVQASIFIFNFYILGNILWNNIK